MIFSCANACRFKNNAYLCIRNRETKVDAEIAQLVEHNLAKVGGREFESRFPLNVSRKKLKVFSLFAQVAE